MAENPGRNVRMPQKRIEEVQDVANKEFGGNFSLVIRKALDEYLEKRGIRPEVPKKRK